MSRTATGLRTDLPYPFSALGYSILTPEMIPSLVPSLSVSTSSTTMETQARQKHLVWDVIWEHMTVSPSSSGNQYGKSNGKSNGELVHVLKPAAFEKGTDFKEILSSLIKNVVENQLLGENAKKTRKSDESEDTDDGGSGSARKATDLRLALALTLVRDLVGIPFVSLVSGKTLRLELDSETVERTVLNPTVVQKLFVETVGGGRRGQHILKPMALETLEQIKKNVSNDDGRSSVKRRTVIVRSFLRCEPRFDSKTKTTTIQSLLQLDSKGDDMIAETSTVCEDYMSFLMKQIVNASEEERHEDKKERVSSYAAIGYTDLLFHQAKAFIRSLAIKPGTSGKERKQAKIDADSTPKAKQEETGPTIHKEVYKKFRNVLGFFMTVAFFDCSSVASMEASGGKQEAPKNKKRKSKDGESEVEAFDELEAAKFIRDFRNKKFGARPIPLKVRRVASARFFSLVADFVSLEMSSGARSPFPGRNEQRVFSFLSHLYKACGTLERHGAKRWVQPPPLQQPGEDNDKEGGEEERDVTSVTVESIVSQFENEAQRVTDKVKEDSNKPKPRERFATAIAVMAQTLALLILSCGKETYPGVEGENEFDADRVTTQDEDEDTGELALTLVELPSIAHVVIGTESVSETQDKGDEDDPLAAVLDICITLLSSGQLHDSTKPQRGASSKLIREVVKMLWTNTLALASTNAKALSQVTINELLGAIGVTADEDKDSEEDENEEMRNIDSEEDEDEEMGNIENEDKEDESVLNRNDRSSSSKKKQAGAGRDYEDGYVDKEQADDDNEEGDDDGENDIEIDPTKLQTMLEEGSDAEVDEGELEHHAGADAALAKLIQMKQESRKAGRQERERYEISRQLRCTLLLETLLVGKPTTWGRLLRIDTLLQMVTSILIYRKELDKFLSRSAERGSTVGNSEKRALVDKLTSLLKTKLFKLKLGALQWNAKVDKIDFATKIMGVLQNESTSNQATKEQQLLCSSAMSMTLRSMSNHDEKLRLAKVYADAVTEWTTQRRTRVTADFFENLIGQHASIARVVLVAPLAEAAKSARSSFLKAECFRLLSLLVGSGKEQQFWGGDHQKDAKTESDGSKEMLDNSEMVFMALTSAFKDNEMQKSKRVRDVLRAAESFVAFVKNHPEKEKKDPQRDLAQFNQLKEYVEILGGRSDSEKVKRSCAELVEDLIELSLEIKERTSTTDETEQDEKTPKTSGKKPKNKRQSKGKSS